MKSPHFFIFLFCLLAMISVLLVKNNLILCGKLKQYNQFPFNVKVLKYKQFEASPKCAQYMENIISCLLKIPLREIRIVALYEV